MYIESDLQNYFHLGQWHSVGYVVFNKFEWGYQTSIIFKENLISFVISSYSYPLGLHTTRVLE